MTKAIEADGTISETAEGKRIRELETALREARADRQQIAQAISAGVETTEKLCELAEMHRKAFHELREVRSSQREAAREAMGRLYDKDPDAFGFDKSLSRGYLCDAILSELAQGEGEPDAGTCPECGEPTDTGHDRCYPPNPYVCSKCEATPDSEGECKRRPDHTD